MDLTCVARKLGISDEKSLIRKAAEFRRRCDVEFDSSRMGVGEVCKAVICLEISARRAQIMFDPQNAIRLSGLSEKAYNRVMNTIQHSVGLEATLDVRELAIKFGCVRIIPFVRRGYSIYKDRFLGSLPASRQGSTNFSRPVFLAAAFYLCAKKHKLKVDKVKLLALSGTTESEFSIVTTSMLDLCHDIFGVLKEKKDPRFVKGNRDLLDVLPEKRSFEDDGYLSDDQSQLSSYKRQKVDEKHEYEEWKSNVLTSNKQLQSKPKRCMQMKLSFPKI